LPIVGDIFLQCNFYLTVFPSSIQRPRIAQLYSERPGSTCLCVLCVIMIRKGFT